MSKNNFHESFSEHDVVKGPTNENFGYTVGGIFMAIALIKALFFKFGILGAVFLVGGGVLVTLAMIKPEWLTQANKAWMGLGKILFYVVNPVIMFLLFAVAFVPAGFIMKLIRHDPMKRSFDKDASTYWITKEKTAIEKPMKYQF